MSAELSKDLLHTIRNQLNNISINTELAKLQIRQQHAEEAILASLDKISEACKECAEELE